MERGLNPYLNPHPGETDVEFRARLDRLRRMASFKLSARNLTEDEFNKLINTMKNSKRPLLEKKAPCPEKDHWAVLAASSIKTKAESIGLEMQGAFGNRLRSWNSLSELMDDPYDGLVAIRYKEPNSNFCQYDVPKELVKVRVNFQIATAGAQLEKFFFNEMGPHAPTGRIFQGEVMRTTEYLYLYYSLEDMPMRPALKDHGKHATGLRALSLLRMYMESSAFEDLQVIFDTWPNAVVEFTTFSKACGHVVGRESNFRRQTVFWEVREY